MSLFDHVRCILHEHGNEWCKLVRRRESTIKLIFVDSHRLLILIRTVKVCLQYFWLIYLILINRLSVHQLQSVVVLKRFVNC